MRRNSSPSGLSALSRCSSPRVARPGDARDTGRWTARRRRERSSSSTRGTAPSTGNPSRLSTSSALRHGLVVLLGDQHRADADHAADDERRAGSASGGWACRESAAAWPARATTKRPLTLAFSNASAIRAAADCWRKAIVERPVVLDLLRQTLQLACRGRAPSPDAADSRRPGRRDMRGVRSWPAKSACASR